MLPRSARISVLVAASLAASLASRASAAAQAPPRTTPATSLLALSKQDHTLAIIDPSNLHIIARIPVGDDPHEVIASSDGKTAYVSNYGFGAFHTLAVIDLVARMPLPSIDLGALAGPHGLDYKLGKVWFTAEAAKAIASYDPSTHKINWIMGTGQDRTHMLYVFPDGQRIVTTNVSSATVTILEKTAASPFPPGPPPGSSSEPPPPGSTPGSTPRATPGSTPRSTAGSLPGSPPGPPPGAGFGPPPTPPGGNWEETVLPVGRGSEGFDISPDGREAWVANAGDGTLSILDLTQKRVTATLAANVPGANRLKFTPDGKLVFVTAGSALVIFDAATHQEVKRLASIHGSGGIQMQPDGSRAYVACGRDGYVAVIDLKTLEMTGRIDIPSPDGLAWAVEQ
jgi:DNA-binding beta-propeller fold protein YncE